MHSFFLVVMDGSPEVSNVGLTNTFPRDIAKYTYARPVGLTSAFTILDTE